LTSYRRSCRALLAISITAAAAAIVPTAAGAVTLTVTGDDGNPIGLGGAINIRNMSPMVVPTAVGASDFYGFSVTGPNGAVVAVPATCYDANDTPPSRTVDYVGNGVYTVTLTRYTTNTCGTVSGSPQAIPFTITASTAITAPATAQLTRKPGSFVTNTVSLPIDLNPGALSTDAFATVNVAPAADGSPLGTPVQLFPSSTTRTVDVSLNKGPGTYYVTARAKGFTGSSGQFFSPWAAPAAIRAFAPFDLKSFKWTDSRGPSYRFHATIMEPSTTGSVNIAIGRGTKGKYKSYGTVKIRKHQFSKRFSLKRGKWRIRFKYKGNATVVGGFEVRRFEITRRTFFRGATTRASAVR
jgi:hypothetical protein